MYTAIYKLENDDNERNKFANELQNLDKSNKSDKKYLF